MHLLSQVDTIYLTCDKAQCGLTQMKEFIAKFVAGLSSLVRLLENILFGCSPFCHDDTVVDKAYYFSFTSTSLHCIPDSVLDFKITESRFTCMNGPNNGNILTTKPGNHIFG